MKKGLLTVLLASLVLVGCQNYDDQFDDLNAQISALKSQVDGLSSLSGQVSSLAGTISGLQSGVAAAQAAASAAEVAGTAATAAANAATTAATAAGTEAAAATAAANAITATDLSGLEASLATLATDVAAVQASLATAATASAVTALQAELDAIESDLDDLLASSNIYSTDVTVTNATTLNSALALGNKLNVLNATLTITGYASMDYAAVQTLIDRVNTMTGNLVYSAYNSTGTEVVFNNLVSAGDIDVTQPAGYSFPKLQNAGTINLQDNYKTTVTNVSFPVLTTVSDMQTEGASTGSFTVDFAYATSVDFGSLATTPGTIVEVTTKKDATLDLGSWVAKDAAGNYISTTLSINGPASFTNGTAAGTFASTGLPGNTVGAFEGTINLTNVATAAVHNFRGTLNVNAGVKNFTGNNIVSLNTAGNDLETVNVTFIRNNTTDLDATAVAALAKSSNAAADLSFGASHTKLTSLIVDGLAGDVIVNAAPAIETVDLGGATVWDITVTTNPALTSYVSAAKAEDIMFDGNAVLTTLSLSHATNLTVTGDTSVSVEVDNHAELTSLTLGMTKVNSLSVDTNAKLASITGTSLTHAGTTTAVNIDNNAMVASSIKDTMETDAVTAATGYAVGGSTDGGTITTASGMKSLDAFLTTAVAATGTVSVWFDEVTKLETQAAYGGVFTDNTSNLGTVAYTKSAAQVFTGSSRTGYYAYVYSSESSGSVVTNGKIDNQVVSYAYDRVRNANTLSTTDNLGAGEGFKIVTGAGTYTFADGDAYASAANSSSVQTVADLMAYVNADQGLDNGASIAATVAEDGYRKAAYTISYTNSSGANAEAGLVSGAGALYFTFGTDSGTGDAIELTATLVAGDSQADLAKAVMTAINGSDDYSATTATGNSLSNRFFVTKNVSGTGTMNESPEITSSSFPTISFNTGTVTTTAILTPSGYDGVITGKSVSETNARGTASSFFSLPNQSGSLLSGLRLTLVNNGNVAFTAATTVTIAGASNVAIVTTAGAANGADGLIKAGINISSYVSETNEGPASYVASFENISSGTEVDTSVAAVSISRLLW